MKISKLLCNQISLSFVMSLALCACAKEKLEMMEDSVTVYRAEMSFNGVLSLFDEPTRSASNAWIDDSRVFLQLTVDDSYVRGEAVYDADTDKWSVEFYKEIPLGQELLCHAYYFDNPVEVGGNDIVLNERSVIYRDVNASYYYDGQVLSVDAHLTPITGRVRFEGTPGSSFKFSGVSTYTSYSLTHNKLTSSTKALADNLSESGKSGDYYVFFPEDSPRELSFYDNTNKVLFSRNCSPSILAHGKSGYMTIPTVENHKGWNMKSFIKKYTVGTVDFNMVLVQKGSFDMGSTRNTNEKPIHMVTLTKDYYLAETEVTQALWEEVMGDVATEGQENYPRVSMTWYSAMEFIDRLNHLTGEEFRLPTEAEWEYAARGGRESHDYPYSGSETMDSVGWYYYNSNKLQPVGQKHPNELGLYDMSGNVEEWCQDFYASYTSEHQIDPVCTSGSYRVLRGGSYEDSSSYCTVSYRYSSSSDYSKNYGFRLASY